MAFRTRGNYILNADAVVLSTKVITRSHSCSLLLIYCFYCKRIITQFLDNTLQNNRQKRTTPQCGLHGPFVTRIGQKKNFPVKLTYNALIIVVYSLLKLYVCCLDQLYSKYYQWASSD